MWHQYPINDRPLTMQIMLIGLSIGKFVLNGGDAVHNSNHHCTAKQLHMHYAANDKTFPWNSWTHFFKCLKENLG